MLSVHHDSRVRWPYMKTSKLHLTTERNKVQLNLTSSSRTMAGDRKTLHVVVFPWLAFGHIIPYFELAKLIAQKGHKISFISTPRNIQRLPKLSTDLSTLINFIPLTLPQLPQLPKDAEATMDVPFGNVDYLKKAFDGLEPGVTEFLEASLPDWIIYDFAQYWLPPIAKRLGISRAHFLIMSAWFAAFFGPISHMIETGDSVLPVEKMTAPPEWIPFPTKVAYKWHEVKPMVDFTGVNSSGVKDWYRYACCASGCDVYVTRHCNEFEPEWLNVLQDVTNRPVVPLGLMLPSLMESDNSNPNWLSINEWLNKQSSGSVLYVALGSEVSLSHEQLTELALGLELSSCPFFWTIRKGSSELPDGFLERTKNRGIVWTSWAPQLRILSHISVGGFLTHCGWGSTIEGLQFGCPLVMLPFMLDQGLNARLLEDMKVGVEIARDNEDGSYTRNSVGEAIKSVMGENEMGIQIRDNAKKLSSIFGDKVKQDEYVYKFVEYLQDKKTK